MIIPFPKNFNYYWEQWTKKRNRLGNPQTLTSRNLYILPSGFGWAYGLVVLSLFVAGINSQINTIFLMTFLLMIIGLISMLETHANLKNLTITFKFIKDAFQNAPAKLNLSLQSNNKIRFGVEFTIASQPNTRAEKIPLEGFDVVVPIETPKRGHFPLPRITISSFYPFGIFRVWSYLYFEAYYYVYPQPVDPGFWPKPYTISDIKQKQVSGDEEFYELKQVENPWIEPKLIHWKIAAKGQGWYLKTMDSHASDYWLFKLDELPAKDLEVKLQNLSFWLQSAEATGLTYGLELKEIQTSFSRGAEHLQHCLRQLALY